MKDLDDVKNLLPPDSKVEDLKYEGSDVIPVSYTH